VTDTQREKATPATPPITPSSATHPSWASPARSSLGRDRDRVVPSRWWDSTVEDTQASTTKAKASRVKSRSTTSMAKKAPARGALNAEAMPAAVPAPARSRRKCTGRPRRRLTSVDTAAPSSAIGPSGPTEPPPPMVSVAAAVLARAGSGAMEPSPCWAEDMTPLTP